MRVLPTFTVAVTEQSFRKRKRILMLFPGLVAFALYHGLRLGGWHSDILALLFAGGLYCMLVAVVEYGYGREKTIDQIIRDEGFVGLAWFGFRFGFLYGIQLSLMVLALLKVFSYSYAKHPDGPAMMALIIASTSVARDAFELGHLRLLRQQGRPFMSFPNGRGLWALISDRRDMWMLSVSTGAVGLCYLGVAIFVPWAQTDLGQLIITGLLAGAAGTASYLKGLRPSTPLSQAVLQYSWKELFGFFVWPGVTFAWTYDLILLGVTSFVIVTPSPPLAWRVIVAAGVGGLVTLYCYYMGRCRWQEEKLHSAISPAMLRCPFISGILTSKKA
jgi:hypothetical protein